MGGEPEGSEFQSKEPPVNQEGLRQNDRAFAVLRNFSDGYDGYHLVVGGMGVAGVLGRETRQIHDLDIVVPRQDLERARIVLEGAGFNQWRPERVQQRLHGNAGTVMQSQEDGFLVDLAVVDQVNGGVINPIEVGSVFIPQSGLDYPAVLRGIEFRTFAPEIHYFFKERATRRNPLHTILPVNRGKDVQDLDLLKSVINIEKAKSIIRDGLNYEGRHPLPVALWSGIKNWLGKR